MVGGAQQKMQVRDYRDQHLAFCVCHEFQWPVVFCSVYSSSYVMFLNDLEGVSPWTGEDHFVHAGLQEVHTRLFHDDGIATYP